MLEKHKLLNTFSQNLAIMGTTFYFRIAYKCEISIVFWFFKADYLACPLEVCQRRDTKQLYAKAQMGKIQTLSGWDVPFELPPKADVVVESAQLSIQECVGKVFHRISSLLWPMPNS